MSDMLPFQVTDAVNEASIMSSLEHPNIVQYYRAFEFENKLMIVMELCQG